MKRVVHETRDTAEMHYNNKRDRIEMHSLEGIMRVHFQPKLSRLMSKKGGQRGMYQSVRLFPASNKVRANIHKVVFMRV